MKMIRSCVTALIIRLIACQILEPLPTMAPTAPPSIRPSSSSPITKPTFHPSKAPSPAPSSHRPTSRPSRPPSGKPSRTPSKVPTSKPTRKPTARPTRKPSRKPTSRPTTKPSRKPTSKPTRKPSLRPTPKPTRAPTASPSSKPSAQLSQFTIPSVILFDKCNLLDTTAQIIWSNVTADTILPVLNSLLTDATSLQVVVVTLEQRSSLILQVSSPLYIEFDILVSFRSTTHYDSNTIGDYILTAFDTVDKKTNYIFSLQQKSSTFSSINKMIITIQGRNTSKPTLMPMTAPEPPKDDSTVIIAATAVGGILSIFACACLFRMRRRRQRNRRQLSAFAQRPVEPPHEPTLIQVLDPTDEDVSTLSDGQVVAGGINIFGIVDGNDHTDGSSMISSDYDYNMVYGGAGDIQSISTAGGMKSAILPKPLLFPQKIQDSCNISRQSSISSKQSDPSAVSMKESLTISDDNSFERQYGEPEERIEVFAPSGKLGIVIDTPNGGVPMVHAIKESSVLIDQVRVGDKLVMVDGFDTTSMSAIKVSRLISTRSDNPRRVLVFLRYRMDD